MRRLAALCAVLAVAIYPLAPIASVAAASSSQESLRLPDGGTGGGHGSSPVGQRPSTTFGAAPSSAKGPDGRPYFTFTSSPGGRTTDHVAITNYTHKSLRLQVYSVDAVPGTNGTISFPPKSAPRREAGAWLAVGTPHNSGVVVIKPRSVDVLPVRVRIPDNAPPGDHVAGIVVSLTGLVSGSFGSGGKQNVKLDQRIAVRAAFNISGKVRDELDIEKLHASYSGPIDPFAKGHVTVTYTVHNGGNAVLGGPQRVTVHGLFGGSAAAKAVAQVPPLLPGASYPVTVTVPNVYPELIMSAKVSITPEGLLGDPKPTIGVVSSSVHFLAIPWIILLVLLLLILGFALRYWRRRRRRQQARGEGRHRADPAPDPESGGGPQSQGA